MKRILGPLLLVLLLIGVGVAVYFSVSDVFAERSVLNVRGVVSSEKEAFFRDPRVVDVLRKAGFTVTIEKDGSRQMATRPDINTFDFAFTAGVPAAEKIRQSFKGAKSYDMFYSPMVIASWKPIVQILEANGLATNQGGIEYFNVDAYLKLVEQGKRWSDLQQAGNYPVGRSFLITSTDVRKSNSADMYLALASYVYNGNSIVVTNDDIQKVQPLMSALFLKQGFSEYSTEVPFSDYLTIGMGKSPLVMIYEDQWIYEASQPNTAIRPDMVLLYPAPTIDTKHVMVTLTDNGVKLADFMKNSPEIQQLAVEHGYRTGNQGAFTQFKTAHTLAMIPDQVLNVIDPPSYEVLEKMIAAIDSQYK